mmetsp:Transcript_275/g.804  ORF Transcript_275/g.804 Transcript_275/m.804 type:complete len:249 (-) Transcript_275:92-838(-)
MGKKVEHGLPLVFGPRRNGGEQIHEFRSRRRWRSHGGSRSSSRVVTGLRRLWHRRQDGRRRCGGGHGRGGCRHDRLWWLWLLQRSTTTTTTAGGIIGILIRRGRRRIAPFAAAPQNLDLRLQYLVLARQFLFELRQAGKFRFQMGHHSLLPQSGCGRVETMIFLLGRFLGGFHGPLGILLQLSLDRGQIGRPPAFRVGVGIVRIDRIAGGGNCRLVLWWWLWWLLRGMVVVGPTRGDGSVFFHDDDGD